MSSAALVAVVVRLVRSLDRHADVVRLLPAQLGQLDTELSQVQSRHLLVELLGQAEGLQSVYLQRAKTAPHQILEVLAEEPVL